MKSLKNIELIEDFNVLQNRIYLTEQCNFCVKIELPNLSSNA